MVDVYRTAERVRHLSADDFGYGVRHAIETHASNRPDEPPLADDDPYLLQVLDLMPRFGGVIFTGPPGTSKSWYAAQIARHIAGHNDLIRYVQFHPSYQYEDFMEGFVPKEDDQGFKFQAKHFVELCLRSLGDPLHTYVLVIDELSRGDPGRVFGEALTYVERSKRELPFRLASGHECSVPHNLFVLATMNPLDRGVDEVDAAFERRFAKIAMDPSRSILGEFLEQNDVDQQLRQRIIGFFDKVNSLARANPHAAVGHTYFRDVYSAADLRRVWDHQLCFLFEKAYRLDPDTLTDIQASWNRILGVPQVPDEASSAAGGAAAEVESGNEPV